MKELFFSNIPASIAVIGLVGYFFGMAIVFILNPIKNAESFSVKPVDKAAKPARRKSACITAAFPSRSAHFCCI